MRHKVYGRHLNRTSEHRRAMFRNLAAALFEHGEIRTTAAKAKAVQPFVEKLITLAKQGTLQSRRELESRINDRRIFAWVADPNISDEKRENDYFALPDEEDIKFNRYGELKKSPRLVQHIITKVAPLFADRDGGYTRIVKLDEHRLGDGTDYVLLQFVGLEEGPQISGRKSTRRAIADKRTAFAASLRKDSASSVEAETTTTEEPADSEDTVEATADDASTDTSSEE